MANNAFNIISSFMTGGSPNQQNENFDYFGGPNGDNGFLRGVTPNQLERSILDPCSHPVYLNPNDQPCSNFFQQQGAIDFKDYLRLKREERLAVIQYHAAVKIQALWRGFLIRSNWKIVEAAAIKIQERDAKIRQKKMEEAAIKIQAAWRGYISRKNKLDFKKYKEIQEKNEALRRSIERINELESALLKTLQGSTSDIESRSESPTLQTPSSSIHSSETIDPCVELAKTDTRLNFFLNNMITPSVESFHVKNIPDYVNELSESRIAELYAYMANMESEMMKEQELEKLVSKAGGIHKLSEEQLAKLEESRKIQKERANGILDLAKMVMTGPLKRKLERDRREREGNLKKDSVDDMFPTMPEREDLVRPDTAKVQALKDAIRMFRTQGEANMDRDLKRKHVLLRTKACPGIYSDIYTTELTEIEQKLKSLKFWKGSIIAEKIARREKLAKEKRLKRLFTHALKLTNKRKDGEEEEEEEGTEEEDEEEETEIEEEMPLDLYGEFRGEMGPEDDGDYDNDSDYSGGGSRRGSAEPYPPDPRPPPPTPINVNNVEEDDNGRDTEGRSQAGSSRISPRL